MGTSADMQYKLLQCVAVNVNSEPWRGSGANLSVPDSVPNSGTTPKPVPVSVLRL